MAHANGSKQREAGKTRESLEDYDVEQAIRVVLELGEGLIEATKHAKHHFRKEWLDQLVARYRERPGKPIVHLSDLPDQVIPTLSADVRKLLRPYWERLVSEHGSEWGSQHFRCMWDIMKSGKASRWSSLRLWKRFSALTGLRIDDLERYTVAIRAASTGTSRVILNPKLPFNLATPQGAKTIGYRGDAAHDTSAFNNLDPILHEDYKQAIARLVGKVPFTTTLPANGVARTNVGIFVTMLVSIAGLDTKRRQKLARNPLPSWFFVSEDSVRVNGLKAFYDAEGSPTAHSIQLTQAQGFRRIRTNVRIPPAKVATPASKLEKSNVERLLRKPPPILVSTALLLYYFGIISYMGIQDVWKTKDDYSVGWNLSIYRMRMMQKYRDAIGFVSPNKAHKLQKYTRQSSPPPIFSSRHSP